ncbi:YjbF family lipoprotein [Azoarcus sp. KH32C]|uniref:YjbF family lipoprotein n=1 Tax=Azoarcus sp. KH32C TaxID=748247 RepID=UPI0021008030|nr:YjbF family lipoprotein [Azoarcus sp. KH32C]
MRGAVDTFRASVASPPELNVKRDDVMARPRYQLRLDSPFGAAVMVLGRVTGSEEYWVTSSRQVFVIEHGLIRRSAGFPENLEGTRFIAESGQSPDPFVAGLHRIGTDTYSTREVDWMPGYRYGVRIRSRFQRVGIEEHEILGERRSLLHIDEHLRGEGTGFEATNRYWVDPQDGFVFISEQSLFPGLSVRLTQLRPRREASR